MCETNLLHDNAVDYWILDIFWEILHCFGVSRLSDVIIHPTQQNLFWWQFVDVSNAFVAFQQRRDTRTVFDINSIEQADLDEPSNMQRDS